MDVVTERYQRIKDWLASYEKFTVMEMDKEVKFHFAFGIWGNKTGKTVFPLKLGYLKNQVNEKDCLMIGFHWIFAPHPVTDAVIKDPIKTKKFVHRVKISLS